MVSDAFASDEKFMVNALMRNVLFFAGYLVFCALYLWFDPIVRSPACYVVDVLVVAGALVGLAWTNHYSFRGIRHRWLGRLARIGIVTLFFIALAVAVALYSRRIQPKVGELVTHAVHSGAQQGPFFPPLAFHSDAQDNAFVVDWYTEQLAALREDSFYVLASDTHARAFRFTCLRSFNNPFCVVIRFNPDGRAIITAKMTSGAGGYAPGKLWKLRQSTIRPRNVRRFLDLIEKESFWSLPSTVTSFGFDGSRWFVEGVDGGRYHLVDRWTPEDTTPIGRLGREMLALSGMRVWFLY